MIADFLADEEAIVERLKAAVPALRHVEERVDTESAAGQDSPSPAAFVEYIGSRLPQGDGAQAGDGLLQEIQLGFMVTLVVRRAGSDGRRLRREAGPLISEIFQALAGWLPDQEGRPLSCAAINRPAYKQNYAYFPLVFQRPLIGVAQ
ncbi:phage tail terminator protein [Rhodocyclus tenuis]|uniref:DUF3168 domain-containing protein n=1 Tax=Rhodocyclus tenuis TaxID=1066 RepID=A0A840G989_RHOTE|nr:hypothetical protein [Rhodocyclus tenuis]MBB4247248.1 hypothetical protein [Rhodocyclus tenuis]